jgi:hypothetical protein
MKYKIGQRVKALKSGYCQDYREMPKNTEGVITDIRICL